ncbi:MAG TPA: M56 family metallopeptidase [Gemmatimonadales bacterium]|nr:M56 family metallopeptidase [Gemmatimonadales bacterium]
MNTLPSSLLAWLLTYLIHSTALLGIAWLVTRRGRLEPHASDLLWKVALLAPLITGSVQSRLELATPQAVRLPVAAAPHATPVDQGVLTPGASPGNATASVTPGLPGLENPKPALPSLPLLIVLFWAVIALVSSLYYVARRLILVGRLADRRAVSDGPLAATLAELRQTTRFRGRVHLTMARTISSPVALGLSEICVPELALSELGTEQQRSMLAHELAHLARRDSLWLLGASLMERVFFFQPLNRLARKELETSAEYLSDEWAMRKTGSAVSLAKCLATVAEWIQASPLGVPVAGLAERRSLLVSRISRLLEGGLPQRPASRLGWAALATLGVVVTVAAAPHVSEGVALASIDTTRALPEVSSVVPRKSATGSAGSVAQDTGVVVALIARLKDENAGVRRAAASSLGRIGDPRAVTPLIAVLADSDAEVRREAVDALSNFEDSRAINPIAGLLKDPDTDVRRNALNALSHFERGVPTASVVALLDDPDKDVRREAVQLLDNLHVHSAAGAIAKLVKDQSSDVRESALRALGNLGDQSSAAVVTEALSDPNSDVRESALGALDDMKAPIAEATLIKLMTDTDSDVRQRAARLAGDRSVVGAIPSLRRLVDDPKSDVRETATQALGNIADPSARQALQAALQSRDPKVRQAAAQALGQDP